MAFLYLMNIIHIVKNRTMSICRFVRTAFIGHRETAIVKIEGGKPTLILVDSGYLQSSKKMMGDYRERLFDYCQKRGFQVLVLLEANSFNKSCQNWAAKKVLQLVEKQYINTIIIVGGISQKRWIEILKSMIKRKVEIEYLSTSEDINTYR
ncbi:hypothetical protein INF30_11980 [Lachnospiraceae bacterium DSM 108991]|jgi:hypothetical protein|uniref:Uncharacterized protein n=1 Tax=Claveliimonas monacensis TaxID=2779351 RepID=A0ABR9RLX1_9FIRM|nr:hypothetical protein [Claveliimonas monacensis]MBE5063972.1 hypothetical protein [Claveliimonas monacensis]